MPQWLTSSVIYEINVATFSAAGNFAAVTARLGDIESLGCNLLWLMPIHPLGKLRAKPPFGSEYAIRDYYGINPDYGTPDDLHALIRAAHGRKMRVIIDIVANHTSWDSVMMEHPDFYKHDAAGRIAQPNDDWTDVAGLDYSNPRLRTYMIQMLTFWLREFDLDGFRCDVAGLVPTDFWEQARPELERVEPDLMMLAEWSEPDLLRRAFDIDYSWDLYKSMRAVMTAGAPATDFRRTWEQQRLVSRPAPCTCAIPKITMRKTGSRCLGKTDRWQRRSSCSLSMASPCSTTDRRWAIRPKAGAKRCSTD
jgi:cyclomaltodextrinase / maltogenic alpha-amylase / neopullulanase